MVKWKRILDESEYHLMIGPYVAMVYLSAVIDRWMCVVTDNGEIVFRENNQTKQLTCNDCKRLAVNYIERKAQSSIKELMLESKFAKW